MTRTRKLAASLVGGPIGRALKSVLVPLFEAECWLSSRWAANAHLRLRFAQWYIPPSPKNMDHRIDLFHGWLATRNPVWVERGVFNAMCLKGGRVLELTCGDGFNTRNFYSLKSQHVTGCDIDEAIIRTARKKNGAPNVTYVVADIVTQLPAGQYQNVIWDFAYPITEFFSTGELDTVFRSVKAALNEGGVFSGYTMAEDAVTAFTASGPQGLMQRKEQLLDLLKPYFANVTVFETLSPGRKNLYFWASDGPVPFHENWPGHVRG
jgi:SAM-dependent methyltransferase